MKTDRGSNRDQADNDIAIIGMACRFPGNVNGPREFWNFLLAGGDGIVEVPSDRWENAAYYDPEKEKQGRMYVNRGGFIRGIDQFDPQFFGISPKEAPHIDPQHRWLLELTYEALENAGLKAGELKGSDTAVYIGQFMHDYEQVQLDSSSHRLITSHSATGPSMTLTSNRISYAFDWTGPSVTLDTACSSSLVALDMAVRALLNGDSKLAIAGGVNILLRPELTMSICKASMLSPDGRCKSFDASANGYVRSEGAGVVLVKKLADAIRDGDPVLAVIKATGVNQDGQTVGITVPNGESQKKLLKQSLGRAGIDPKEIQYAEAHGTGTAVGDPIEVNALGELLGQRHPGDALCVIGSVKSNIGHMEATAGMAGLMKAVLAMDKGVIPRNIHFNTLNPAIDLDKLNIRIAAQEMSWPDTAGRARKAIVNSFGFGGTNANVVLEQAPSPPPAGTDQKPVVNHGLKLLPISSKTEKGLKDQAAKYLQYLQHETNDGLHDICYTAAVKREHHKYRLMVSGVDKPAMIQGLQDFIEGNPGTNYVQSVARNGLDEKIVFVFSGMGPQWAGMGRELYRTERVFRAMMDRCSEALQTYTGWSLIDALFNAADPDAINSTHIAQPAIFAVQVSLAELLKSWGVVPSCVVGHSAGEVGAAYVAGALGFEDAVKVIYHRSRLQHTTEGTGKMLAVEIGAEALKPYLSGVESRVSIAAINSEQAITLAGDEQVLASIAQKLDEQGLFARFLNVGVPYHSPVMDRLKEPLIRELHGIQVHAPKVPLYSTVTAQLTREGDWGPEYWADNVREPVLFKAAIENIATAGFTTFLEIAPHPVLSSSIEKNLTAAGHKGIVAATLKRNQDDVAMISGGLAMLHAAGYPLNWKALYPDGGRVVYLPNYAWQHAAYWCESEEAQKARLKNLKQRGGFSEPVHPLLGGKLISPSLIWQKAIELQDQAYLSGHQVEGNVVYPGAAYLEMALAVAGLQGQTAPLTLENVEFKRAFFLDKEKPAVMETSFDPQKGRFRISAAVADQWSLYSEGVIAGIGRPAPARRMCRAEIVSKFSLHYDKSDFYQHCHRLGLTYLGDFQPVEAAWYADMESLVEIRVPADVAATCDRYWLHPVILDGAFQGLFPTINSGYLPVKIGELHYYRKPGAHLFCYLNTLHKDAFYIKGDLTLFDESGEILVEVLGCELKSLQAQTATGKHSLLYDFNWRLQPLPEVRNPENGQWIVLADSHRVGRKLAAELERRAQSVCLIEAGCEINSPAELATVFNRYSNSCQGVIYLRALDGESCESLSAEEMLARCRHSAITPLYLAQALDQVSWKRQQSVYLVTQSVHRLTADTAPLQPAQGALWGFGRVFASEHPEHRISMVDLAAGIDDALIAQLADEVMNAQYEQEIALRPQGRHVNRLRKLGDAELEEYARSEIEIKGDRPFRIVQLTRGAAAEWRAQALALPELADSDIEIKVEYAGVCKRNVGECVGTVVRIGRNVKDFAVGERVMGFTRQVMSSLAHMNAVTAARLPANLSSEQAATIPVAFLSAHYSLNYLADLQAGETVLIHEAADPVGLAAVQLAQFRGARIFATAATEEKRSYLRKLGLENVFDSTGFEFAREIAALLQPQDRGIDVALNVLSGQFVDKTLGLMNPFGRFVELCHGDIKLSGSQWEILIERNISYHSLSINDLVHRRDQLSGKLLHEIVELLDNRQLSPLPVASFPAENATAAMTALEDNTQIRKLVLEFKAPAVKAIQGLNTQVIRPRRSYLVTGGLGGLGLEIMRWLAAQGAESIVLIGRSQPSVHALKQIEAVQAGGVTVTTLRADVAEAADVRYVLGVIEEKLPPLAGIIHSAGVLEDGTIAQQTADKFHKVLAPKVKGAWNLHCLTSHLELDLFVCFSSIAAIVGWAGQSNYAAANTFMDTLVCHRRALGKPALSINWGPWSGSGMAASLDARDIQRMNDAGMAALAPEQGLTAMSKLLTHCVSQAGVFDLDWARLIKQYPNPQQKTLLQDFIESTATAGEADFIEQLKLTPESERAEILEGKLGQILAEVLGLESASGIDREVNVFEYGMNSLMAMDFKNRLQSALKFKLPATLVSKHPTVSAMARHISETGLREVLAGEVAPDRDILLWEPAAPAVVKNCEINGPLPPSFSVMHWLHEGKSPHFNGGFLAEFDADKFNLDVLKTAMRILLTYHDGARLQLFREGGEYRQEIMPLGDNLRIDEHDLRGMGHAEGAARIQALNAEYQRSFSFTKDDPLFRIAYFQVDDVRPHRLLVLFHHFVTDGLGQMIFARDLEATYLKVQQGRPVYFPPKRESLMDWTRRLHRFAKQEAAAQIPYWLSAIEKHRSSRIPQKAQPAAPKKMKYSEDFIVGLDRAEYRRLVELCAGQHFEVTDIATYALIKAFSKLTGSESLLVDLAIRARTGVFEDLDISSLFGQISEFAAVPFELESGLPLFDQLNSLREQRARVPNAGLGLKALKFAHTDPEVRNRFASGGPQVILNFDLLNYAEEMPSEWAAGARPCSDTDGFDDVMQQIHIRGSITEDGGLSIVFWYRPDIFNREDVSTIAAGMRSILMRLAGDREVADEQAMERA